jgi:MYXO-CTERM domain-containing protein
MRKTTLILAAALLAAPAPLLAQDTATDTGTTTETDREDDDRDFPWGLLGLLGLAGLMGRKRNDRDVHVDARRDNR